MKRKHILLLGLLAMAHPATAEIQTTGEPGSPHATTTTGDNILKHNGYPINDTQTIDQPHLTPMAGKTPHGTFKIPLSFPPHIDSESAHGK
jgi:hypothetical protein